MPKNQYTTFKGTTASCWYCGEKCRGILTFFNGDEVFACEGCAGKKGRIKRLRKKFSRVKKGKLAKKTGGEE